MALAIRNVGGSSHQHGDGVHTPSLSSWVWDGFRMVQADTEHQNPPVPPESRDPTNRGRHKNAACVDLLLWSGPVPGVHENFQ